MSKTIIIVATIFLGLIFALWDSIAPPTNQKEISIQQYVADGLKQAPNPSFTSLSGTKYNLYDFKGKTVLINFWATWCPPCIIELPQLLELAEREGESLIFIALSVDDKPEDIERYFGKLPDDVRARISLDNVIFSHDKDKLISKGMFNTTMYPESYIINKDMMIVEKIEGIIDWLSVETLTRLYK